MMNQVARGRTERHQQTFHKYEASDHQMIFSHEPVDESKTKTTQNRRLVLCRQVNRDSSNKKSTNDRLLLSINSYLTNTFYAIVVLLLITSNGYVHCQVQNTNGTSTSSPVTTLDERLLISNPVASSYVDFHTDNPILLFDGLANESTNSTTVDNITTTILDNLNPTTIKPPQETTTISETNNATSPTSIATLTTNSTGAESEDDEVDDEEATTGGAELDETGKSDDHSLATPFVPPQNVSQYMDYIERLFHDLRHQISYLFEPHIPQLIRTSQMVELSPTCSHDILRMALALRQLEPWALRMIDSSGKLPEGIFEGSFTSLGSYDQCLNIIFNQQQHSDTSKQSSNVNASLATQGKYCLVNVSPFLPPKPSPFERVDKLFQEEANRRNYSKDDQFSRLSPMFYYMRFRIGICVPSTCDSTDMFSISQALSSSLKLNITIDTCRFKQPNVSATLHQLVAGSIGGAVVLLVLIATLIDYWQELGDKLLRKQKNCCERIVVLGLPNQTTVDPQTAGDNHSTKQDQLTGTGDNQLGAPNGFSTAEQDGQFTSLRTTTMHKMTSNQPISRVLRLPSTKESAKNFQVITDFGCTANQFDCATNNHHHSDYAMTTDPKQSDVVDAARDDNTPKMAQHHWKWRSFSLIANFKLYWSQQMQQPTKMPQQQHQFINCLNGIRVISLCWVIVANSYVTLDPRATKGLTRTREAPRDFLFQLIVQASLAIETFFFLSGLLMSLSFARHQLAGLSLANQKSSTPNNRLATWVRFYLHRYVRLTVPAMLIIAFAMFSFRYGDGPLWYEVTHRAHLSCNLNWWRHLVHVSNYIDTRQTCFIHYWYIAADMQLFIIAPLLLLLLNKFARLGLFVIISLAISSMTWIFHTTFVRNLPPTLLFYSSDPESRREYGNTIMTKPYTHLLPYLVGMLLGHWLTNFSNNSNNLNKSNMGIFYSMKQRNEVTPKDISEPNKQLSTSSSQVIRWQCLMMSPKTFMKLLGSFACSIVMAEIFLPYLWNNSQLPSPLLASLYAAFFRLGWALSLAYLVMSCRHKPTSKCTAHSNDERRAAWCWCGSGGSLLNQFLSWNIFNHLSRLSFIAYLIHLPLMSVFVAQTRAIFAFSHMLVIHLALSYLLMTFILSFILIHIIEFPFLTLEGYLFERFIFERSKRNHSESKTDNYQITSLNNDHQQQARQVNNQMHLATSSGPEEPGHRRNNSAG